VVVVEAVGEAIETDDRQQGVAGQREVLGGGQATVPVSSSRHGQVSRRSCENRLDWHRNLIRAS